MFQLETTPPLRLATPDVDDSARFWQGALGLTTREQGPDHVELVDEGERVQVIVRRSPTRGQPTRIRISAYDTQDVVAAVERLVSLGASPPAAPYPETPGRAFVEDPDGNTVEILARVEAGS